MGINFKLTLAAVNYKRFLLLEKNSREVLYFVIPRLIKININHNNLNVINNETANFIKVFETVKNNLFKQITKKIIVQGVGFNIMYDHNSKMEFKFGFTHTIKVALPKYIFEINVYYLKDVSDKIFLTICGNDVKSIFGYAATIRNLIKINRYKQTGILYKREIIKLKKIKKK